jgi:mono/diheme cytochrome c family protein
MMPREYAKSWTACTVFLAASFAGFVARGASLETRFAQTAGAAQLATPPNGAQLFHEKGCEQCHGVNGAGVPDKGPSLMTVGKRLKRPEIALQIQCGGGQMPSFAEAVTKDERNALVDFLAQKKKAPKGTSPTPPLTPRTQSAGSEGATPCSIAD